MLQRFQSGRQHKVIHIISNKRIVCRADTKLESKIETGRRFTATRHAQQNHLRLIEIAHRNAIVVGEGVIDGGDACVVLHQIAGVQTVGAMGDRRRVELKFAL
ncbi:hypothetical protein D3C71_1596930 [compost metagenome]